MCCSRGRLVSLTSDIFYNNRIELVKCLRAMKVIGAQKAKWLEPGDLRGNVITAKTEFE